MVDKYLIANFQYRITIRHDILIHSLDHDDKTVISSDIFDLIAALDIIFRNDLLFKCEVIISSL